MSELVTVTLKMTAELRDRLKARATAEGTSVSALLIGGVTDAARQQSGGSEHEAWLERRVAELEAKVAGLTKDRDQWRDRAEAIVSAGAKPAKATPAIDAKRPHVSGPVLASAVPAVDGAVEWCGLKGMDSPKSKR